MAEKTVLKFLVDGGKANAAPLAQTLAPLKMNIGEIVNAINENTKEFSGISVPVEVIVDTSAKSYEIKVGTPPVSQLIKKELKLEKLAQTPWGVPKVKEKKEAAPAEGAAAPAEAAAPVEEKKIEKFEHSIGFDSIVKIAKIKLNVLGTHELKKAVKEVIGTCHSCGVMIEDKKPKDFMKEVSEGKWDSNIK